MYVLGINSSFHDTAACLVKDGNIVVAIEEERLIHEKHTSKYPMSAIRYCLQAENIQLDDIDLIVSDLFEDFSEKEQIWLKTYDQEKKIKKISLRHHLGHAAAAFFCSGFQDAAIITTDGGGTRGVYKEMFRSNAVRERQVFWRGSGNSIYEISTSGSVEDENRPIPASIGHVYEMACDYLGYGYLEGPGKVMGLASYGTGSLSRDFSTFYTTYPNGQIIHTLNELNLPIERIKSTDHITKEHQELAYMVQKELEYTLVKMANHIYNITQCKYLCIGGGVGLNCVANTKILENTPFEKVYLFPACADSGIAVGNALYGYYHILKGKGNPQRYFSPYTGIKYTETEVKDTLDSYGDMIKYQYYNDDEYVKLVAKMIENGQIVSWFYGSSEIGPRALGNRSILADARNIEMKDILNQRVKHREYFRPFAPAVLKEKMKDYFTLDYDSPYMLFVSNVKDEAKDKIPSVTHIDNTARVQTVSQQSNPMFYKLIKAFGDITGIYVILNTSFNDNGQPIVEKPKDAVDCFLGTNIDVLAIENYIVTKG